MHIRTGWVPAVTEHHNILAGKGRRRTWGRTRVPGLIGVLVAFAVLATASCGRGASNDNGVATAGGANTASPNATSSVDQEELARKFQECMKEQGVDVQLAGPGGGGGGPVRVSAGAGQQIPDQKKAEAAMQKCKQYAPNGGEPPKADPAMAEAMLRFAKCMRDNGVANFPDPDANGGTMIEQGSGIDPESDSFKAAQQTCQQFMPAPEARITP
jgi:hypothetical protein